MDAEQKLRDKLKSHPEIYNEITDVFGDNSKLACDWLENPKIVLNDETPDSLLESDSDQVLHLLQRIKYGDFS